MERHIPCTHSRMGRTRNRVQPISLGVVTEYARSLTIITIMVIHDATALLTSGAPRAPRPGATGSSTRPGALQRRKGQSSQPQTSSSDDKDGPFHEDQTAAWDVQTFRSPGGQHAAHDGEACLTAQRPHAIPRSTTWDPVAGKPSCYPLNASTPGPGTTLHYLPL